MNRLTGRLAAIFEQHQQQIVTEWIEQQLATGAWRAGRIQENQLRSEASRFISLLSIAVQQGTWFDSKAPEWSEVRDALSDLSRSRVTQGFSPTQVATFIFSLKQPLFRQLRHSAGSDQEMLAAGLWEITTLLDSLGLFTMEIYQQTREGLISRQQEELMELSTPVVELWPGILALPLIGTLDSERTQVVMENLLQRIVTTGSSIAVIDITGVPTVDTLVAQHLLKTVAAAQLMGAECIISGIRPQIAQTIVHLGIDLAGVATKASLSDAFALALRRRGLTVTTAAARS